MYRSEAELATNIRKATSIGQYFLPRITVCYPTDALDNILEESAPKREGNI